MGEWAEGWTETTEECYIIGSLLLVPPPPLPFFPFIVKVFKLQRSINFTAPNIEHNGYKHDTYKQLPKTNGITQWNVVDPDCVEKKKTFTEAFLCPLQKKNVQLSETCNCKLHLWSSVLKDMQSVWNIQRHSSCIEVRWSYRSTSINWKKSSPIYTLPKVFLRKKGRIHVINLEIIIYCAHNV